MKLNRKNMPALLLALLIIVGIGSTALVAYAQDTAASQPADQPTAVCGGEDADNVQEEVQSENEADDASEVQCPEDSSEAADTGAETDAIQDPTYAGSIAVNNSATYADENAESSALASMATITKEAAQAAVEAATGGTVTKVELDNENGVLVYSVELQDGTDVKVDAGNGAILHTEAAGTD